MARTEAGKRLTQEHKLSQARLADATSQAVIERLAKLLDPKNIDATRGRWLAEATAIVHAASEASASKTEHYLELYAEKEGRPLRVVLDRPTPAVIARSLDISGPVTFKSAIKKGVEEARALAIARTRAGSAAQRTVRDTGRRSVIKTATTSHARWRRVTDGHPCAFCAMLAARGPVYSEDSVDFIAHGHCGCDAEVCFETPAQWLDEYATDQEVAWVNAYHDAAEVASARGQARVAPVIKENRRQDTILFRMRRLHPELFSDGVY
nr:MAG TPA: minor capsid protein 2 [Caudoviricetes sp.]